jgi:hypothetical protein
MAIQAPYLVINTFKRVSIRGDGADKVNREKPVYYGSPQKCCISRAWLIHSQAGRWITLV